MPSGRSSEAKGVGHIVRKLRLSHGLKQGEFGKRFGASQDQVSRMERGTHQPSIRVLQRVARAFGGLTLIVRLENADGEGFEWRTGG